MIDPGCSRCDGEGSYRTTVACGRCDGAATYTPGCCDYDVCSECGGTGSFEKDCGNCHGTGRNCVDVPCRCNTVRLFRGVSWGRLTPNVSYDSRPDPVDTKHHCIWMLSFSDASYRDMEFLRNEFTTLQNCHLAESNFTGLAGTYRCLCRAKSEFNNVHHFADQVLIYVRSAGAKRPYLKLSYTHVDITCLADVMKKFIQRQLRGHQFDKERII